MSDARAIYFAGATFLFCTSIKEVQHNVFRLNITMAQYLFNWFILGFSGGILTNSITQLLKEK